MVYIRHKELIYILIIAAVTLAISFLCVKISPVAALSLALIPFLFLSLLLILVNPFYGIILTFLINYFAIGLSRYISAFVPGIMLDISIVIIFFSLLVNSYFKKTEWKKGINLASIVSLIWVIYCIFEFFNPNAVSDKAWLTTVRGEAFYFFLFIFLTCIVCRKHDNFKTIIYIWGVLTLIGTLKAVIQKYIGFDYYEKIWLYRDGGYTTHLIGSGTRYFSFFSDASIFGATMGMTMIVFLFLALIQKKRSTQIFFYIVSIASFYSLLLSGTRAAFIIPLVGSLIYIILSKNLSAKIISIVSIIIVFSFFSFTNIGNSNQYIRRMRTAFHPTEDASFQVRLANQQILKDYMADKPFGAGIGHAGVKAKEYTGDSPLSQIPTDSWFVMIWVETGIVGLILNIMIWISIIIYCSYIIIFKLKNPSIRGEMVALLSGITGILVASYGNEILGQMPVGVITYSCVAFIILGPDYEREQ